MTRPAFVCSLTLATVLISGCELGQGGAAQPGTSAPQVAAGISQIRQVTAGPGDAGELVARSAPHAIEAPVSVPDDLQVHLPALGLDRPASVQYGCLSPQDMAAPAEALEGVWSPSPDACQLVSILLDGARDDAGLEQELVFGGLAAGPGTLAAQDNGVGTSAHPVMDDHAGEIVILVQPAPGVGD
jgi:hypothetical protein